MSPTGLEVVSSLLRSVRETVLAGHAGVAGGDRDGTRKYRSTGRAPQAHGGHVVCRTSNSAPRCHKVNRVRRERLLGINCPHDFRRCPVQTGHKLRHDLHIGHDEASVMLYFKHQLNPDCISTSRQTVAVSGHVHKNKFTHEQGYIWIR